MPENIYVKAIEFRSHGDDLDWVQFKYSDGTDSDCVQTSSGNRNQSKTLELKEDTEPVRKVKAHRSTNQSVKELRLLDKYDSEVAIYDPTSYGSSDFQEFEIGDNEKIIGFYGSGIKERSYFKTFGFIVRVQNYQ